MRLIQPASVALSFLACVPCLLAQTEPAKDRNPPRILSHQLQSAHQSESTLIRVLLPQKLDLSRRYPVLYVLPVESGLEDRYGDGLKEVHQAGLADRHGLICVSPSFSALPWFADNPTNKQCAQESYLIQDVLPLIENHYPVKPGRDGRWLLGFSKSGWGACSLLLRHPQIFDRAVIWDAPLMMDEPGRYGSGPVFGTPENFRKYQLTALARQRGPDLGGRPRVAILGFGNFKSHHDRFHEFLLSHKIPHAYEEGIKQKHAWDGGWLTNAFEKLISLNPVIR